LVRREGAASPGRAADIVAQVALGLDAIHRAGYVHRDVKPANVLLDLDGHVYVTDFGLAKHALTRAGEGTRSGQWVGTLDYVAPEQIRGGRVDARADVYALGGVLHFLLTGKVPFDHEGDEAKLWAQLSEPPPLPSHVRPGLPPELDAVVTRAMAKSPDARFPSAGDLGRAARAAAAGVASSLPERVVARGAAAPAGATVESGLVAEASTVTATRPEPHTPPTAVATVKPRRSYVRQLSALALVLAAAVVWLAWPEDEPTASPPSVTPTPTPSPTPKATPAMRVIRHVGLRPNGIVVAQGVVWVTSNERDEVERIGAASGRKLRPVRNVGRGAQGIVSNGRNIWIARKAAREIVRIDARTGRVVQRIDAHGSPSKLALGLNSLWFGVRVARPSAELVRLNLRGDELSRRPVTRGMAGIATGGGSVWVVEHHSPRVLRLDPPTLEGRRWGRFAAKVSKLVPGGGYLWATMGGNDMVGRIDPRRRGPTNTTAEHSPDTAVWAGGHLYVTMNTSHLLRVFNSKADEAARPIEVPHNPFAITADKHYLWVTGTAEHTVTRIPYH
jgi:hypothetical protein